MTSIRLLWLLLCLLWLAAEFKLARTAQPEYPPADCEQQSQRLLWFTAVAGLALALLFKSLAWASIPIPYLLRQILALALFATGLNLRYQAIDQLGAFFTTNVQIRHDHQLILTGPYRRLRHPAYTGLLLAFIAIGLAMGDALALVVLTLPLLFALKWRVEIEEAMLCRKFGDVYRDYCKTTWRLLPWLF